MTNRSLIKFIGTFSVLGLVSTFSYHALSSERPEHAGFLYTVKGQKKGPNQDHGDFHISPE